jgi:hypothetical protein
MSGITLDLLWKYPRTTARLSDLVTELAQGQTF